MTNSTMELAVKRCFQCGYTDRSGAKFCGGCGASWSASPLTGQIPAFAQMHHFDLPATTSQELHGELGKLMLLLARERLFLYTHWIVFLGLNLLGVYLSYKCYHEFMADEVTRMMVASTPFWFTNAVALVCIGPIKRTRQEIARLKERLAFVHFKIEFGHLM